MARQVRSRVHVIIAVLLVALVALSWRMFSLEGQTRHLDQAYERARQELDRLQAEHGLLEDELLGARGHASTVEAAVESLRQELTRLQQRLGETTEELTGLRRAHDALQRDNTSLVEQLARVTEERQQLQAKFSSIKELQLALLSLKRKMREERWAAWRARWAARREARQAEDAQGLAQGNRGYVVRDGQPTLDIGTRLQVRVHEPSSP